MNILWQTNAQLNVVHAAWCVANFPDRAKGCPTELREAAQQLDRLHAEFHTSRDKYWEQLLALACASDSHGELANRLSSRLGGATSTTVSRLVGILQQCRHQFARAFPTSANELPLRSGPMRQLWEGCGPGLLRLTERQTGQDVAIDEASIVLVQPILGGYGYAHLLANRVHVEAILTHTDPRLPESLRLAWLLSQLDLDRPQFSEQINAHRLRAVAGLAMLPAVLCAGEELEICRFNPELLTLAIDCWYCPTLGLDVATASSVVTLWWETFQASRPAWRIALTGLDRLLPDR